MNEKFSVELELITSKIDGKISKLKQKLDNLGKSTQVKAPEVMGSFVGKDGKTYNYVRKTQEEIEASRKAFEEMNNEVSKDNRLGDYFEKGIGKIKRFTLALVSVRSIFAIVSRASSAYLNQDTELASKLQSVWIGLGSVLAPLIEKIANFALKVVAYVNYFIKALTGVDLLAKATKKSMDKANKSAKATSKTLAGFDEITNLNSSTGGGTGGTDISDWGDKFKNIKLDKKITNVLDSIAKTLDNLYKNYLKPIFKWIKENPDWATGIAVGIGVISIACKGLLALGLGIAFASIVVTINKIVKFIKDPSWMKFADVLTALSVALGVVAIGLAIVNLHNPIVWILAVIGVISTLTSCVIRNFDTIKSTVLSAGEKIKNTFSNIWSSIKTGVSNAVNHVKDKFNTVKTSLINVANSVVGLFKNIGTKVGDTIGSAFKTVINSVLKSVQNILNTPIKAVNKLLDKVNELPGVSLTKLSTFSFPQLAVGTNYVPNDQLAMIHKGEAVIPKKFNSREYFGSGNETTNALLEQLINVVVEKDTSTYLDGREIGKSTINYINSQSRIYGRSVIN